MTSVKDETRRATDWGRRHETAVGLSVGVAVIAVVVVAWWVVTDGTGLVKPLYFPSPSEVADSLSQIWRSLFADAAATLVRVLVAWSVGSVLGVAVGLAMVRSRAVFYVVSPLVESLRPVPPVALIPFIILWFGIGDSGKIVLGALACFMVMVVNTIVSAGNVNPVYSRAARSLGAKEGQVYRTVILPAIVPELVSGLRIGSALAFAVIVAAEFLGADAGIGRLIMQASRTLNTPVVLIGTIVITLEAVAVDRLIKTISGRLTRWSDSTP